MRKLKRFFQIFFYTISMYMVTHIIVFISFPLVFLLMTINQKYVYQFKQLFSRLILSIVGKKLAVYGHENIDCGKNYLIVANYPSYFTGFILVGLFPQASIVVHDFPSKIPLLRGILLRAGVLYAHKKGYAKTREAINSIIEKQKDHSIIILPEGRCSPDGCLHNFKRGYIYILRHSSLDLLPLTFCGFFQFKPLNRMYLDPDAEPRVMIHPPVNNALIQSMPDEELLRMTRDIISDSYIP